MDDRKIKALRDEIAAIAPTVEVHYVGPVQSYDEPEAIVGDPWGQYLWSHYRKEHGLHAAPTADVLPGQLTLF
jgi:hypothetical protein